jgi:hypothetical protein
VRAKCGYRRVYVSDELDRLYGEYVWRLCEVGADLATNDFDGTCGAAGLDPALDAAFARHGAAVVGGTRARGESTIGTCRRADHAQHLRARDRGHRDAGAADWKAFTGGWRVGAHRDDRIESGS